MLANASLIRIRVLLDALIILLKVLLKKQLKGASFLTHTNKRILLAQEDVRFFLIIRMPI